MELVSQNQFPSFLWFCRCVWINTTELPSSQYRHQQGWILLLSFQKNHHNFPKIHGKKYSSFMFAIVVFRSLLLVGNVRVFFNYRTTKSVVHIHPWYCWLLSVIISRQMPSKLHLFTVEFDWCSTAHTSSYSAVFLIIIIESDNNNSIYHHLIPRHDKTLKTIKHARIW